MTKISGVVAILTGPDGHVWATTTDFDRSGYGGFSLEEAQTMRAKRMLAHEFIRKSCSEVVARAMSTYRCEEIVNDLCRQHGFTRTIVPVGQPQEPAREP